MGYYDYFKNGENYDQIKAWGHTGNTFRIGSECPPISGQVSYSIVMREGYVIRVENCKIVGVDNYDPTNHPDNTFDKWGDPFTIDTVGLINEPYFYSEVKNG